MRTIIFDLDGTLLDSRQSILNSINHAFDEIGHKGLAYCQKSAVQQDLATTIKTTAQNCGLTFTENQVAQFISIYRKHHSTNPTKTMKAYDGVESGLESLRKNFRLAVATTKHTAQAELILQKLKLDHFFEHIQGTDPGLRYKPAPDILFRTLEKLGEVAETSAYVGDSVHDMHAAKAAGMKSIGAAYGFSGAEELKLVAPDFIVHCFDEIVSRFQVPLT